MLLSTPQQKPKSSARCTRTSPLSNTLLFVVYVEVGCGKRKRERERERERKRDGEGELARWVRRGF